MPVYEIGGQNYRFDEGISLPGAVDILVSDGTLTPEQGAAEVGEPVVKAETGGLSPFLPDENNSVSAAQAIGFGRRLSQIGFGQDQGNVGHVYEDQPIATGFGENIGLFAAGPTISGAALVGGGLEAMAQRERFKDDPVGAAISTGLEGARQAAFTAGGRVTGELTGRVVNSITNAARNGFSSLSRGVDNLTLPSGIKSTLGKITGNKQIQQAEASLARNPITSRKFVLADQQNAKLMKGKVLAWLGKPPNAKLEAAMANTVTEAIAKMDEGIPNSTKVVIPGKLKGLFSKLNKVTSEAFDLPTGPGTVTGQDLRSVVSDLRAGTRSGTATVRQKSRQALNELDNVLQNTAGIDQEAWREGSQMYGRWERLSRPGVISRIDPEKVNPTSLFRVLEKGNKVATRTRGAVSSGDDLTDDLLRTAKDLEQVGSLTPDSGTPTGLAIPIVAADIVATGGIGTAAAFGAAEVVESPVGLGIAEGLSTSAGLSNRAGGVGVRQGLSSIFPEEDDQPNE